jgi:hypothetical protein
MADLAAKLDPTMNQNYATSTNETVALREARKRFQCYIDEAAKEKTLLVTNIETAPWLGKSGMTRIQVLDITDGRKDWWQDAAPPQELSLNLAHNIVDALKKMRAVPQVESNTNKLLPRARQQIIDSRNLLGQALELLAEQQPVANEPTGETRQALLQRIDQWEEAYKRGCDDNAELRERLEAAEAQLKAEVAAHQETVREWRIAKEDASQQRKEAEHWRNQHQGAELKIWMVSTLGHCPAGRSVYSLQTFTAEQGFQMRWGDVYYAVVAVTAEGARHAAAMLGDAIKDPPEGMPQAYMVNVSNIYDKPVVYVKGLQFFRDQQGFRQGWGQRWCPVIAKTVEEARLKALEKKT